MLNNTVDKLENVGSKTLLNAVFSRPEQVVHFLLCADYARSACHVYVMYDASQADRA